MINQALILVGGKGSRLGTITKKIPKPLLKINDKPFLDYLIKFLLKFKIKKIILLTNSHKRIIALDGFNIEIKDQKIIWIKKF